MFQSTHPRGVRLGYTVLSDLLTVVSIHAPAWGATISKSGGHPRTMFQSTHPRGVRLRVNLQRFTFITFQSTHPRGVRLETTSPVWPIIAVSIHAPAWGATNISRTSVNTIYVSIHAPAWGATYVKSSLFPKCRFQSTHPRGVRHGFRLELDIIKSFNPRTRVGCDRQKQHGLSL